MKPPSLLPLAWVALGGMVTVLGAERDPVEVGKWPAHNGPIVGLAVEGQYAYCLLGAGTIGLQILDISDPTAPTPVGFYEVGAMEQLVVQGGYAFLVDEDAGFAVIDVRNPRQPVLAGSVWEAWGPSLAISGNRAYVGGYGIGYVLDISDPTHPELVGSSGLLSGQVAAAGDYAYAVDYDPLMGRHALKVIDVTNPASPQLLGSAGVDSGLIHVSGDLVVISTQYDFISLMDVSDPFNPRQASAIYGIGGRPVTVVGDFLYVYGDVLHIFNIRDLADPRPHAIYPVNGYFVKSGDYGFGFGFGYEPYENDGLHVLDLSGLELASPPVNPEWVGHHAGIGYSTDHVAVSGNHAYTVGSLLPVGAFLEVVDLSDSANPIQVGVFTNWPVINGYQTVPGEVVAEGDRIYIPFFAGLNSGVCVLDVSDKSTPQLIDTFSMEGPLPRIAVAGDYAYLAYYQLGFRNDEGGLVVLELNHPSGPREVGRYSVPSSFRVSDVALSGDHACLLGREELIVLDISDPANPSEVGRLPGVGGVRLDIAGTYAGLLDVSHVSSGLSGLNIVDLGNPVSPQLVGTRLLPGQVDEITLSGNRAFVVVRGKGVQIVDLENPMDPQPLYLGGIDVAAYGRFAVVADGPAGLRVIDTEVLPLPAPEAVGSYETFPGREFGPVFVNGHYAYVVSDGTTLHVLDTSDASNPRRVGRYDDPFQSGGVWAFSGDMGCFLHEAEAPLRRVLEMIDLSVPTNPRVVGTHETAIEFQAPYLHGNLLFLSCREWPSGAGGFDVLDISDPSNPHPVGSYRTAGEVYGLHPTGSHVFLGVWGSPTGCELISVSDPTQPQFVKLLEIEPDNIRFIEQDKAYVRYQITDNTGVVDEGVEVLDVSDPLNPVSLARHSEFDVSSLVGNLALGSYRDSGRYAGLGLIDTGDLNGWKLSARFGPFGNWAYVHAALAGDHAVVGEEYAVRLFDLRPLANPQRIIEHEIADEFADAKAVFINGDYAFVADWFSGGLLVCDLSDPSNPQTIGSLDTAGTATDVAASSQYAYIADWDGGLLVLDISTPANPQFVAALPLPDADVGLPEVAERVVVVGSHAYVTGYDFHVIDVSNPALPVRVGGYDPPDGALAVAVAGNYAYVAAYVLHVIDITNPNDPLPVGSYEPPGGFFRPLVFNVAVSGNLAYLASEIGLLVVDVSDPADPRPVGSYPGYFSTVVVAGNHLYATERYLGLLVLDVTDPAQPRRVGGNTTVWDARDWRSYQ